MTDSTRDTLAEKYGDLYETEGYHMIASAPVYIPYWSVAVQCHFLKTQAMTSMELTVLQCIDQGITKLPDIAFVMAMDTEVVQKISDIFVDMEILTNELDEYHLTSSGRDIFAGKKIESVDEKEDHVFKNGVTGEITLEGPSAFSDTIEETSICLGTDYLPGEEEINQCSRLYQEIGEKYDAKLRSMKAVGKEIRYCEEYVLFYKNKSGDIKFQIYDQQNHSFDLNLTRALLEKYEKRRLYEIMKVEEILRVPEKILDTYQKPVRDLKYCRNQELRELFKQVFRTAKKSIFIVAPWIDNNNYVITDQLLGEMKNALEQRNIQITIRYGYLSEEKNRLVMEKYDKTGKWDKKEEKNVNTELKARELRNYFKNDPGFHMSYLGTHEKILCYDERYIVVGSFNFLSYDGGEKVNYGGSRFRFEGGVLIDDPDFARYVMSVVK